MQTYISDQQLAERFSVSRSTIWRWASKAILPEPVQLSPGTTRWIASEIEQFELERAGQAA